MATQPQEKTDKALQDLKLATGLAVSQELVAVLEALRDEIRGIVPRPAPQNRS